MTKTGWVPRWDYYGMTNVARMIDDYIDTPLADILQGNYLQTSMWMTRDFPDIPINLRALLSAADRRIGKNHLSVRLFQETYQPALNIIGSRL